MFDCEVGFILPGAFPEDAIPGFQFFYLWGVLYYSTIVSTCFNHLKAMEFLHSEPNKPSESKTRRMAPLGAFRACQRLINFALQLIGDLSSRASARRWGTTGVPTRKGHAE